MGRAIELISVQATAPGASYVAFAAVPGNSLTIRDGKGAKILGVGIKRQVGGSHRFNSTLLHDATIGIQQNAQAALSIFTTLAAPQPVESQDTVLSTGTGSAVAGDIEQAGVLVGYDDLAGADGRFIDSAGLRRRVVNIFSKAVTIVATAAGGYTGSVSIAAADDLFKANTDYALLGIATTTVAHLSAVRVVAPDWGNIGLGVWSNSNSQDRGATWFVDLSDKTKEPCIPIFNSSNRSQVLLSALSDENGASTVVVPLLAELRRTR